MQSGRCVKHEERLHARSMRRAYRSTSGAETSRGRRQVCDVRGDDERGRRRTKETDGRGLGTKKQADGKALGTAGRDEGT